MKLTNLFLRIGGRIILLFATAMAMTFLNDWLVTTGFFGDAPCPPDNKHCGGFESGIEWGARHCWYFWMCALLFLLGLVAAIAHVVEDVERLNESRKKP